MGGPGVHGWLVGAALSGALLGAAPASAPTLSLSADRPERGWIRVMVKSDAPSVQVSELTSDDTATPIATVQPVAGQAVIRHAAIWRCDRRIRRFTASARFGDGTAQTALVEITTPSCRRRLAFSAAMRRKLILRVTDRWKVGGVEALTCAAAPGRKRTCRTVRIASGRRTAARAVRARSRGIWTASMHTAWDQSARRLVYVRPRGAVRLLATGDSMIQIVDTYLAQRLAKRHVRVRSDARISTGLSKPFLLNWPRHANRQARSRPDVTVAFLGANDGFPIGSADCCGDAWVAAYAARAKSMMAAWSRGGRGLVYWLTLPAPKPPQWRRIYPAINRAIKRAAASFDGRVRVLDIARTFTPGYRFRQSMVWHGRRVSVRNADGVHLNSTGASIAEALVQRALARDGVI